MFECPSDEWFAVWHFIRRREEGMPRQLGLEFLDRVRRFRKWPRPSLQICISMPWLPSSSVRAALKEVLSRVTLHARTQGHVVLLPAIRDLKLSVTQVSAVTLAKVLRPL